MNCFVKSSFDFTLVLLLQIGPCLERQKLNTIRQLTCFCDVDSVITAAKSNAELKTCEDNFGVKNIMWRKWLVIPTA